MYVCTCVCMYVCMYVCMLYMFEGYRETDMDSCEFQAKWKSGNDHRKCILNFEGEYMDYNLDLEL